MSFAAKKSLSEALTGVNANEDEKLKASDFANKVSDKIFKECDSMLEIMGKLVEIAGEARRFQQIEIGARDSV